VQDLRNLPQVTQVMPGDTAVCLYAYHIGIHEKNIEQDKI